ncbi:Na(+) H(+) antiporter subunit E [hydrothermal vent metagenome]|uniref:Na(+) H(+) antiporter subunit E n=1 Tax=hydrothermal vent metagenome TaxID=652676 RepID=A0A3B0Z119_9ZZZZ
MKVISFGVLLFALWVLLSGHLSFLLLSLGVASVGLTLWLVKRMNVIDHESHPVHLYSRFPAFIIYIMREIIKANIDVVKRILKLGGKEISPQLIDIPVPQKTDLGRVIYANSITLTPGTVSVELGKDFVTVHALTKEGANDLLSGDMSRAIPDQVSDK